jgi:hypothetical protein
MKPVVEEGVVVVVAVGDRVVVVTTVVAMGAGIMAVVVTGITAEGVVAGMVVVAVVRLQCSDPVAPFRMRPVTVIAHARKPRQRSA